MLNFVVFKKTKFNMYNIGIIAYIPIKYTLTTWHEMQFMGIAFLRYYHAF